MNYFYAIAFLLAIVLLLYIWNSSNFVKNQINNRHYGEKTSLFFENYGFILNNSTYSGELNGFFVDITFIHDISIDIVVHHSKRKQEAYPTTTKENILNLFYPKIACVPSSPFYSTKMIFYKWAPSNKRIFEEAQLFVDKLITLNVKPKTKLES
jgi:hypothetical protein